MRKGDDRLLELYPEVKKAYLDRRDTRRELRSAGYDSSMAGSDVDLAQEAEAAAMRAEAIRDAALTETSESLITSVERGSFTWGLRETPPIRGRRIFSTAETQQVFFAEQILQRAIASITPRHVTPRQSIIANVARQLDASLPKLVIRTDFERYFENIDHVLLRSFLERGALSPTFRGLIRSLLDETQTLMGARRGLPTGVGVSAKLAEFFLADFDRAMRAAPRTLYYGRYVDDVIVVLGETMHGELDDAKERARITELAKRFGLTLSAPKTVVTRTDMQWKLPPFELLGYQLRSDPRATVSLTDSRRAEITRRIDGVFSAWTRSDPSNHGDRRLLLDRIRYLTGNFRLANNKRNAFVGIYFSNPHLNDESLIQDLDDHLAISRSSASLPADLEAQAARFTFADGFSQRRLHRFTSQQLRRVRRAWNA